jgi:hypothetical protein
MFPLFCIVSAGHGRRSQPFQPFVPYLTTVACGTRTTDKEQSQHHQQAGKLRGHFIYNAHWKRIFRISPPSSSTITTSTMPTKTHRALEAMDIIHVILSHLIDDKRPGDRIENLLLNNANDLLSMAICCKAFEGPSLDLLWREMRSVTPLLRLLSTKATPHESLVCIICASLLVNQTFMIFLDRFRLVEIERYTS